MSVEDKNVIDIIGIDKAGKVILTISDHLKWDDKNEHLLILQEKINAYLAAIEEGDLYEKYPNARDRDIVIRLVLLYNPNRDGYSFLDRAKDMLNKEGYEFQFSRIKQSISIREIVNKIHLYAAIVPFLFTINLILLFLGESIGRGYFPDTVRNEAGESLLRSITIFFMLVGLFAIPISVALTLFRLFFWKSNKATMKFNVLMLLRISSMILMIYLNPFHLFTWVMG